MAITKEKKNEILAKLEDNFAKATAVYFAEYKGLSVKEVSELRRKMRELGADYVVAKKTLVKLAAKNKGFPEITDEVIPGPIGVAFGYDDVVAPSKVIKDFGDAEKLSLSGGILEGKIISKVEALQIASLPGKDQLLAKLVGTMQAPISGFYGALHGVLSKFVRTLDAYRATKSE